MTALTRKLALALLAGGLLVACGKTEVSDVEYVQRAKQQHEAGHLKASLIELKNALSRNPDNAEARLMLGELYLSLGNGVAAEIELERARKLGVAGKYIDRLETRSRLLQGKFEAVVSNLAGSGPDQPEQLSLLGEALFGLGRLDEAERAFRQAQEADGGLPGPLIGLVRVALARGDMAAAERRLAELLSLAPENADAWLLKGEVADLKGDWDEALEAYRKTLTLLAVNTPTRRGLEARSNIARILLVQGKIEMAAEVIDYLLKALPKHYMSNFLAALLAYQKGDYEKAYDYLLQVNRYASDYLPANFLLGAVNFRLGNLEQAEVQLAQAVSRDPSLIPARLMLAEVRLRKADSDEVLYLLDPALEKYPNDARLLSMAGQAALQKGDFRTGRRYLKKAVEGRPADSSLRTQLAMLYLAEGSDQQAIDELERAIDTGKAPERERSLLVLVHLKNGNYDEALKVVQDMVDGHPRNAFMRNLKGIVLEYAGDAGAARRAYKEALGLDSGFSQALFNLIRLDILQGKMPDARKRLDDILQEDPANVAAMLAQAQIAWVEDDTREALRWLEMAREQAPVAVLPRLALAQYYSQSGDFAKAGEMLKEVTRIDPDNGKATRMEGILALRSGDLAGAVDKLEETADHLPVASTYYWLSLAYFRAGRDDESREALDESLRLNPDSIPALALRVMQEVKTGNIDRALSQARMIQQKFPDVGEGYELEADIHALRGDLARAERLYARAHEQGGYRRALLKQVGILRELARYADAIAVLQSWLQENADDRKVRFDLASIYGLSGERDKASKEYERLLDENPADVPVLNNLALLQLEAGNISKALDLAENAYKLMGDSPQVMDTYGWILLAAGETGLALPLLGEAASRLSEPEVSYHWAVALKASGEFAEARKIATEALASTPTGEIRAALERLLGELDEQG